MLEKDFSHTANFTGYMEQVFRIVQSGPRAQRILDIPAGNGLLAARVREAGHEVLCADINREKPDYIFADLNQRLPFADSAFDTCLCLEGIEHTLNPMGLISELCRITKPGGRIVLSLPNIQNAFSRFNFLCTGYFYQFGPAMSRHLPAGMQLDCGHISSLSYIQLHYFFQHHGARLLSAHGDRWKKKWLIPFLLPFFLLGRLWVWTDLNQEPMAPRAECRELLRQLRSPALLFSRSLILTFVKE